jgi:polysaccharide export outer membrane protein
VAALAVGACARQQPTPYVLDSNTGQPVSVMTQQQLMQPQYAQQPAAQPQYAQSDRGLFSSSPAYAQQAYGQPPQYEQQPYAQQTYAQQRYTQQRSTHQTYAQQSIQPAVTPPPASSNGERGLFTRRGPLAARPIFVPPNDAQQPYAAQPQYAAPQGGPYAAAPNNDYAAVPVANNTPYTLDSGDKLRIVVFGQDGITNSYTVDAGGNVNLPLVGSVPARGFGTQRLSQMITERLKKGFVREPHVTVEIETYRPFFILGEVTNPGQYPYVANMTAETAIAIAGGFAPRANKNKVGLTRNAPGQQIHGDVPLGFPLRPGDTIVVKERWF